MFCRIIFYLLAYVKNLLYLCTILYIHKRMADIDSIDRKLLIALQENSRQTIKELAARVSLSTTPVFERVKRLERDGYIRQYTVVLDANRLGNSFVVFCCIKLKTVSLEIADDLQRRIERIPEVTECYNISGTFDYMLKIHAQNMKHYQELVHTVLGRIDYITDIESMFVMDEVKNEHRLPL